MYNKGKLSDFIDEFNTGNYTKAYIKCVHSKTNGIESHYGNRGGSDNIKVLNISLTENDTVRLETDKGVSFIDIDIIYETWLYQ